MKSLFYFFKLFLVLQIFIVFFFSCSKPTNACFAYSQFDLSTDVIFDASCSTNAVTYNWDFGDGSSSQIMTSKSITHHYSNNGTYKVTLTAKRKRLMASKKDKTIQTIYIEVR